MVFWYKDSKLYTTLETTFMCFLPVTSTGNFPEIAAEKGETFAETRDVGLSKPCDSSEEKGIHYVPHWAGEESVVD